MKKLLIPLFIVLAIFLTGCVLDRSNNNIELSNKEASDFIELLDKVATDCTTHCEDMTCEEFKQCQGCSSTNGINSFETLIEECE